MLFAFYFFFLGGVSFAVFFRKDEWWVKYPEVEDPEVRLIHYFNSIYVSDVCDLSS